ncbi:protein arginine methyltransferase [Heterostelium album PN500]|uniref:Protein arginine methyltransferase n=1 Tax=Heterostelium pallidum (strain ATCC 26659 / Pp 5 / PN500) TaxID=670386 RepID=D3B3U2_HETP5|nr:protein arginine methyltransferase [Heterostelium album PN500]EFA83990.1 protein arginine methyltransferase [Heterostelium album PN500]|eukprot:XP_020436107.1 protein arginine methyltransferase [Heterostelium album PN500]
MSENQEFLRQLNQEKSDLVKQMRDEIKMEMIIEMTQKETYNVNDLLLALPLPSQPNDNQQQQQQQQQQPVGEDTEEDEYDDGDEEEEEEILNTHIPVPSPVVASSAAVSIDRKSNLKGVQVEQELEDESYNWKTSEWDHTQRDYYAFNHPYQPSDTYEDHEYFTSYSRVSIHNEMVFDKRRTEAYYQAIMKSKQLFKDKVVMDVGCGTGLLSCFCAMAGAKRVYAVEASDMAFNAELIVNRNNLQDKVRIYKGKVEHIAFPEYVDIIVSEWMGAFLIFESMLESVIYARDHLLKPNGILFPSKAALYVSPVRVDSLMDSKINCWNNVYGLDMSPLIPFAQQETLNKTIRDHYLETTDILDDPFILRYLDLSTITIDSLSRTVLNFNFKLPNGAFHGFASWFSVYFECLDRQENQEYNHHHHWVIDIDGNLVEKSKCDSHQTKLSPQPFEMSSNTLELATAPGTGSTHWKQLLFLFEQPKDIYHHQVDKQSTASIQGTMRVSQHQTYRRHWWVEFSATQTVNSTRSGSYQNYLI